MGVEASKVRGYGETLGIREGLEGFRQEKGGSVGSAETLKAEGALEQEAREEKAAADKEAEQIKKSVLRNIWRLNPHPEVNKKVEKAMINVGMPGFIGIGALAAFGGWLMKIPFIKKLKESIFGASKGDTKKK